MGIFGLLSSKGKGKKGAKTPAKISGASLRVNKSAKKKAKTCEFC